ncbi:MAG TPA: DNA polymerase III subunit alpha [Urbifossiella sp.]|nr:DNA polymerase III subunit alpha [Urbifossiella sp.]
MDAGATQDNAFAELVRKRLDHELGIIERMGFASYFLVVWDFVRFAREKGIPCTARGSGCGAIVAYTLYLSHVCPIEYDLLFERFLDPNRKEAPDIDIDFCQDRRGEVIQYVKEKYGAESVAQIGTFGTLAAKAAIKDVGRVLDVPLDRVNFLCKLVPMHGAIAGSLDEAMKSPDFRKEYDQDPEVKQLVDIAIKLEGCNRNVGTHAAGVVIADGPITDFVPVQRPPKKNDDAAGGPDTDTVTTQWEMGVLEKVGMLKMDFLGLRNLTVLDKCVKLIKRTRGEEIDPMQFDLNDRHTYALLQSGNVKGVFQLESEGIRDLLKRMKPDNIRDLIAVLALYRPGPLSGGMVDSYVNRKHGRETWDYPHPVLKDILDETYGVMVYQEQIMRILNRLGGIDLSKSYACIKAISKKVEEKIASTKTDFLSGCQERGVAGAIAEDIFEKIVFFAGYGFNKCVAASTVITDARTGERTTVGELFSTRRTFTIHAMNDGGKLVPRTVTDVMWNGRKKVYRLRTELGHEIVATGNHPFRVWNGWKKLNELKPGERIAAPRALRVPTAATWPAHEVIALAGLLSEGNTCHPSTLYFYGNDRVFVDDFAAAIGKFPDTVAKVYARRDRACLEVQANTGIDSRFQPGRKGSRVVTKAAPKRSGAYRWAEALGILGKTATAKFVPAPVFGLRDSDLELFLGRLWAGDGFIANRTLKVPFYATSSPQLAKDVQYLLLRLGIVSRIHVKAFNYQGDARPGYAVHVLGDGSVEAFVRRVGPHCLGREKAVNHLDAYIAATPRGCSSKDTVPLEIRSWVDDERKNAGLTWAELETRSNVSTQEFFGTPSVGKRGFRRSTIAKLAAYFNSQRLADAAQSDLYWDRIVSIEPLGIQDTYDLTVDVDHNFVADGLIVHNSHTAAYAQIGYQTAYLKAHYTAEYMAALLSSEIDDGGKRDIMVDHIADTRKLGVDVLPPDINRGMADFDVVNNRILFGLTAIKGLGRGAANEIVRARMESGPFKDLYDFAERVDRRIVPKSAVERLVMAGAFDAFGRRSAHFAAVAKAYQSADERASDRRRGQKNIFDMFAADAADDGGPADSPDPGLPDIPEWPDTEKLKFEKEALDFYMSSHPLAQHEDQLKRFRTHDAAQAVKLTHGSPVLLAGMVTGMQMRTVQKNGKRWAMFQLEDFTGQCKCILWSDEYARFKDQVVDDAVLLFEGAVEWRDGGTAGDVIVRKILTIDDARKEMTRSLLLRVPYATDEEALMKLDSLGAVLKRNRGQTPVFLSVRDPQGKQVKLKLGDGFAVNAANLRAEDLEMILGPGSVIFTK